MYYYPTRYCCYKSCCTLQLNMSINIKCYNNVTLLCEYLSMQSLLTTHWMAWNCASIWMCIHSKQMVVTFAYEHTHTHIHIFVYTYVCMWVFMCGFMYYFHSTQVEFIMELGQHNMSLTMHSSSRLWSTSMNTLLKRF